MRSGTAVRERCALVHDYVALGRSAHFALEESRLDAVAEYVARVTREAYPDMHIPYHSRWRHFCAGGLDRWSAISRQFASDSMERARAAVDLVTISVLLDAGAGESWRYRDETSGLTLARSEGLAVASFDMFQAGRFSSDRDQPCRVDAVALRSIDSAALGRGFQVAPSNPLVGLTERATLLQRLGKALARHPEAFGTARARPGNLVDYLHANAQAHCVSAATVLALLLDVLSSVWPSGLVVDGLALGDAARHVAVRRADVTDRVVPFHKLSQWLAYSLIEPLEMTGLKMSDLDALTGLPEYRNGGLLIDLGVIRPRRSIEPGRPLDVRSELVVEWRALTVTLIDQLVAPVRQKLDAGPDFGIAQLLQGGTWSAGRKIARALRPPDGPSPIPVAADGTVF
ncbi:MAG: URC4/urg3 family protein [Xanthobacteraceae bacterium]